MDSFFTKRKQVQILFMFSVFITQTFRIGETADCLESFQNISCTCTINSLTCTGISDGTTDIVSAVSLLSSNYTYGRTECINITINELFLNSSSSFHEVIAQNLTLGSGLTSLPENLFHGLNESLLNLNLQNNKLSVVPTKSLHILGRLQELDLSNNTIKNLQTNDFVGMPLLIFLNLYGNNIEVLGDATFSELSNLEELLLGFNNLLNIKVDAFKGLSKLRILNLAGNDLQYLEPDAFMPLTSLQTFVLNHNELPSLSSINIESSSLKKLSAQYCALKGPIEMKHFSDSPNLTFLDLSHNNLNEVKTMALSALSHLESLDLSNNAIKKLNENAFSSLSSLTKLNLENNGIEVATTSAFYSLTNLTFLNLDNNKLIALLCEYTADLHSLEEISIQNNRLRKVTAGSLNYSGSLKQLRMEGNDLICDCNLSSFSSFLRSKLSLSASDINSVKCSTPVALQGKRIIDIDFESLECDNSSSCNSPIIQESKPAFILTTGRISAGKSHSPLPSHLIVKRSESVDKQNSETEDDINHISHLSNDTSPSQKDTESNAVQLPSNPRNNKQDTPAFVHLDGIPVMFDESESVASTTEERSTKESDDDFNQPHERENITESSSLTTDVIETWPSTEIHLSSTSTSSILLPTTNTSSSKTESYLISSQENKFGDRTQLSTQYSTSATASDTVPIQTGIFHSMESTSEKPTIERDTFLYTNISTENNTVSDETPLGNTSFIMNKNGSIAQSTVTTQMSTQYSTSATASDTVPIQTEIFHSMESTSMESTSAKPMIERDISLHTNISTENNTVSDEIPFGNTSFIMNKTGYIAQSTETTQLSTQYSTSATASDNVPIQTGIFHSGESTSTESTSAKPTIERDISLLTNILTENNTVSDEILLGNTSFIMNENGSIVQTTTTVSKYESDLSSKGYRTKISFSNNLTSENISDSTVRINFAPQDFLISRNDTKKITIYFDNPFHITLFSVSERPPNYAFIQWTVVKDEPYSMCSLKLQIFQNNITFEEMRFNCTNNSYLITNTKKHLIHKICLKSNHSIYGKVTMCEYIVLRCNERSAAQIVEEPQIILYAILLGFFIAIVSFVLLILAKSVFKRVMSKVIQKSKRYNLWEIEESLLLKNKSSQFSNSQNRYETSEKYSYFPNGTTEVCSSCEYN